MIKALTFDDIQMIPEYSEVKSRSECNLKTRFTKKWWIDIPYVSSPMDTVTGMDMAVKIMELGGVGIIHRFMDVSEQVLIINKLLTTIKSTNGRAEWPICIAVGLKTSKEDLTRLVNIGANVFLIDVAHGNTLMVKETIEFIKSEFPDVEVIAGNVATAEGAENLCDWGADAIRVGIGNGSLCTTRMKTGIGIPQVTAIMDCVKVAEANNIPVIADGGIRNPADVAKAIGLGADTIMLGSLLAGTKETPGVIERTGQWPREQLFKKYRGSASIETKMANGLEEKNVEGESTIVPYIGKVERIIKDLNDGLRSAMSYVGTTDILAFQTHSNFVEITESGKIEARPHLKI